MEWCSLQFRVLATAPRQEGNSWQNVKVEVEAITGSSMLGAKLFWQAHGAITVANFSAEVDK
eukprot:9667460-Alexandrium_andersonii.AAC.1